MSASVVVLAKATFTIIALVENNIAPTKVMKNPARLMEVLFLVILLTTEKF